MSEFLASVIQAVLVACVVFIGFSVMIKRGDGFAWSFGKICRAATWSISGCIRLVARMLSALANSIHR